MARWRLIGFLLLAVGAIVLGQHLALWVGMQPGQILRTDFPAFYVAGREVLQGQPQLLYNVAATEAAHRQLGVGPCCLAMTFANPPSAALLVAPFTAAAVVASYFLWSGFQLLCTVAGVVLTLRTAAKEGQVPPLFVAGLGVLTLSATGVAAAILNGQWDGTAVLGLAASYALFRARREGWAGFALGLVAGLAKPQLFIGVAIFLLARGGRRLLAGAATGVAIPVLAAAVWAPSALTAFVGAPFAVAAETPITMTLGTTGLVTSLLGPSAAAWGLILALDLPVAAAILWLGRVSRTAGRLEVAYAGAIVGSLLISPHTLVQDLALLVPPFLWCACRAASQARRGAELATASLVVWGITSDLAARLDIGNAAIGPPGRLSPWILLVALGGVCAVLRVETVGSLRRIRPATPQQLAGRGRVTPNPAGPQVLP